MPNTLNPFSLERIDSLLVPTKQDHAPLRHRIAHRLDAIGAQVPTRPKVPARSVSPIY
ncbi:MAG: hypothetical protein U5K75_11150 [Ahrensia sp.]|nr:hypothetical protein [Ahrensia sp.]